MPKGVPRDWPPDDELVAHCLRWPSILQAARHFDPPAAAPTLTHQLRRIGRYEEVRHAHDEMRLSGRRAEYEQAPPPRTRQITSDDPAEWSDIPALLRKRGMDPAEWVVVRVRVNEWTAMTSDKATGDNRIVPMAQLRVDLEPRSHDALMPARTDGWKPPARPPRAKPDDGPELVAFFGDQHCPHHDPGLHAAACEWLRRHKPARGVLIGDLLDFDAVSRHRENPAWRATMQECVDSAYSVLRGYLQASPATSWQLLSGNHEERLRNAVLDHLRGVYGLTRATGPGELRGEAVLSISHLLRLDELGIEWVGGTGDYAHEQVKVSPYLAARHGWLARKGSGATARATLDALGHSVITGHTHRLGEVFGTVHDIDGEPSVLTSVEAGTMARLRGGLGHAVSPDWQQGYATAWVWPDGRFSVDLAKYVAGSLLWCGQRIAADTGPDA